MEIHRRMLAQCGQSTMSQRKVYEWVERLKSGRTRVTDEGRSGRPSTSRSRKCIVLQGDYVRKLYVKLFTVASIKAVKCILPLLFDSLSYLSSVRFSVLYSIRIVQYVITQYYVIGLFNSFLRILRLHSGQFSLSIPAALLWHYK